MCGSGAVEGFYIPWLRQQTVPHKALPNLNWLNCCSYMESFKLIKGATNNAKQNP